MRGRAVVIRGLGALALCALCSTSLVARASAQSSIVDELAAIVGGETPVSGTDVVLRSDLELRARLALLAHDPTRATGALPSALLRATLDEVVGELLIAREAERLHATMPSDAAVAAQRRELESAAGGAEAVLSLLRIIGADESELDAIAMRRARVDGFLRANLEGTTVVSDARVEEVYASGEHPFTDEPLERAREPLRAWLAQGALERDVARWISVLRGRTTVRVLLALDE